jgi:alkylated DNA repair dioxygenase AlkB
MAGTVIHTLVATADSELTMEMYDRPELVEQVIRDAIPYLIHNPKIKVWNRDGVQHRNVRMFAKFDDSIPGNADKHGYDYSRQRMPAVPMTPAMEELLNDVNKKKKKIFNRFLLTEYPDNDTSCVGFHRDTKFDETQGVAAISWGSERNFQIRKIGDNSVVANIPTKHCSLLEMNGKFQREFKHGIPAMSKSVLKKQRLGGKLTGSRFSITFRRH